jgi:hypothetical protein
LKYQCNKAVVVNGSFHNFLLVSTFSPWNWITSLENVKMT